MNSVTQQIKERLSIVDVVGTYTKLEKSGTSYKARCPFHNERTPSFFVSPARGSYHCFGCGRGGDIFSFVEEIEGIPFKEVLVMLAERSGVTLTQGNYGANDESDSLFKVLEEAAMFFQVKLKKEPRVLAYLKERGLTDQSITIWRIGSVGSNWSELVDYLAEKGYSKKLIVLAGLSSESERGIRDRFRERIIFPLQNPSGKVIGFSGRLLPWIKSENAPKYLNSPETDVFHKSSYLYGFHRARKEIVKTNTAILVEGQFDLLMAHQAGAENTVAVSGTAFTREHAKILARAAEKIIFVMDADEAGIKASERAVGLAEGLDVRIATLPSGLDPAECVRTDQAAWRVSLEGAEHVIDFILKNIIASVTDERARIREIHNRLYPHLIEIPTEMEREHFIKHIASVLSLSEASIRKDLSDYKEKIDREPHAKELTEIAKEHIPKSFKDEIIGALVGTVLWQEKESQELIDAERIRKTMSEVSGQTFTEILEAIPMSEREKYGYRAEIEFTKSSEPELFIDELLLSYEKAILEEKLTLTLIQLRGSEGKAESNIDEVNTLIKLCDTLARRIHEIKSTRLKVN